MDSVASRQTFTYRRHRLEVGWEAGRRWAVVIRPPGGRKAGASETLRSTVAGGLAVLVEEARQRIDRRLDGAAWQREP